MPTTLFLDRDGVINRRLPGAYVADPEDFQFLPGVLEVMPQLADLFHPIIIITNQQGIGKGLMNSSDLDRVHSSMLQQINQAGGRIDAIYFCPHLKTTNCNCRKPRPGLIEQAVHDFPAIELADAVLVGDSLSDLQLGKDLGLDTIWIQTKEEERLLIEDWENTQDGFYLSARMESLAELSQWWQNRANPTKPTF